MTSTDASTSTAPDAAAEAEPRRPVVAMLVFPGLTLLDLIGPHTTLAPTMQVHLVARTMTGVVSDTGVTIHPTTTLAEAPRDVDVLFVPGGPGTAEAMADDEVLDFLVDRGGRAAYVTSVCTGSLILGAAGLLVGYRAGSHWATRHLLPLFGAEPRDERVVTDRNRITGGGVTAGIDFGLTLVAELQGRRTAELTQLLLEYDPAPPFTSGSPATADPALVEQARRSSQGLDEFAARVAARTAARRQG